MLKESEVDHAPAQAPVHNDKAALQDPEHVPSQAGHANKMQPVEGYRDLPWLVLWVLQIVIVLGLAAGYAGPGIDAINEDEEDDGDFYYDDDVNVSSSAATGLVVVCLGAIAAGVLMSFVMLRLFTKHARSFIVWTFLGSGVIFALSAVVCFAVGQHVLGVLLILMCGLIFWVYKRLQARIEFSAILLATASDVITKFPATIYVAYGFTMLEILWVAIWAFALIMMFLANDETLDSSASFFFTLSWYWTSNVLSGIVFVTASGVVASFLFQGADRMGENPTKQSLNRASTTSLGSICLGSLLVSIVQMMKRAAEDAAREGGCAALFVSFIMGCLEYLVTLFNKYAMVGIAIYGHPFTQAARETWQLFKSKGLDVVIADQLVDGVLSFAAFATAVVAACAAGAFAAMFEDLRDDDTLLFIAILIGALIGFSVAAVTFSTIDSGVATLFVVFAEDPLIIEATHPELHAKMQAVAEKMAAETGGSQPQAVDTPAQK